MSEQEDPNTTQEGKTAAIIVGVLLVVAGLWFVGGNAWQQFGAVFEPLRMLAGGIRQWSTGVALVVAGVLFIVYNGRVSASMPTKDRRLHRSRSKKMVAGVLGGLSDYFGMDPTLLRLAYVTMAFIFGVWSFVIVYFVAAIVVPEEPESRVGEQAAPPPPPAQ